MLLLLPVLITVTLFSMAATKLLLFTSCKLVCLKLCSPSHCLHFEIQPHHTTPLRCLRICIGVLSRSESSSRYWAWCSNCVHGQVLRYLKDLLDRRAPLPSGLRSEHWVLLKIRIPRPVFRSERSTADHDFSICKPSFCNRLPAEL